MIENPPLLRVNRQFNRPKADQVSALKNVPTGFVVDAMYGRGALDFRIKPLEAHCATFTGIAITCDNGPDDNLALMGSLLLIQPGDVIVAATSQFCGSAVTGDLVIGMAKNNGAIGFVTDGLVRDTDGICAVGIPAFCRGVTPNSPVRNGPGTVGMPIQVGGLNVASGDIVVADKDGVVVIPLEQVNTVIQRLTAIRAAEAKFDQAVADGLKRPAWLDEMVQSGAIEEF